MSLAAQAQHEQFNVSSPLPVHDRFKPVTVPEATPLAGSQAPNAGRTHGCRKRGVSGRAGGTATLVGTVRTFDPAVQAMVEQRLKELCSAIALGFGATATLHYERMYPATINTESEAMFAADVAESLVGAGHVVRDLEPSMGAEDFAFMLQTRPGAYLRLGQGQGASGSALHNSRYDFNDDVLPLGSALHASLIEQAMPLQTP